MLGSTEFCVSAATLTSCQIARSRSLPHRINYKFLSAGLLIIKLANERARISAVIVKLSFAHKSAGKNATYADSREHAKVM